MKKQDIDSYVSVTAALIVIFTAMISPSISLMVAIFLLITYAAYKYRHIDQKSAIAPFVFSALVACIFIVAFTALSDIIKGAQSSYYLEYAGLIFSAAIAVAIFTKHQKIKTKKRR